VPALKPNLVKRIERLPKPSNIGDALIPIFEAVSNSIHSTQDRFGKDVTKDGKVHLTVNVDKKTKHVEVTVEDNGHGLNEKNFEAFTTTDTDNKISIGGKGVGRLMWLDCFENTKISSFYEQDGEFREMSFDFVLDMVEQIQNEKNEKAPPSVTEPKFMVHFMGLRDNGYKEKFPQRLAFVFQHLTSHFLPAFIGGRCPQITVVCGDDTRHYPAEIDSIVLRKEKLPVIETEEYGELYLTLMECDKIASSDLKGSHFVHFIAHDRTVHSQKIDSKLGLKTFGEDDRVFHAILTGEFLNDNVNQERTSFVFEDAVIERIVNDICIEHIEEFLIEPLSELKGNQREVVEAITQSYPSVAFGDMDELQGKLPSGELHDDAIYGHLSRERFRRDKKQAEKIRSVLERLKDGAADANTFLSAIQEASEALEQAEQKSLAEYVVRRKVVLDFIEILLEKVRDDDRDSSYQREDILHSFICPLRVNTLEDETKKVVPAPSHDLWIVDERLTFAQYFSSDEEFRKLSSSIDSEERPDVLIFDYVHGLRHKDDTSKVLLVEFKRPGRKSYKDDENPQHQIERYVRRLLKGGVVDVKGRPVELKDDTVFYCFIVADIIGKMDDWTFTWNKTADGRGRLYQPRDGFKGSIELMGWDALLDDARLRNQAFFDKAGISGKSFFSDE